MASNNFDQVSAEALLKQMYDITALENLSYSDRPFFGLVPKKGQVGGLGEKIPLMISTSQGFATNLAAAQSVLAANDAEAFVVTPVTLLSVARISGLTLEASMNNKQAFAVGTKVVVDSAVQRISNGISSGLFRDGSGALATIATTGTSLATGVVALTNAQDSVQFEVNMALSGLNGSTVSSTPLYVIAVDRDAGKLTLSLTLGGAFANLTGIVAAGHKLLAVSTFNLQIRGLAAWLTETAVSTPFFGVDRSKDKVRLSGVYFDGSSLSVKDAIINALNRVCREGGNPDTAFMDFESYTQLAQDLGQNVIYTSLEGPGKISFSGFIFNGPRGSVRVIPDRDCEPKTAYLLQMSTWVLLHAADAPAFLDDNGVGQVFRTVESLDGREIRCKAYLNLACTAPGFNAKVKLSA